MERISLAIQKAKEGASQQRQERSPVASMGVSSQTAASATSDERIADHSRGHVDPKRRSKTLPVLLFLSVAAAISYWALQSDPMETAMSVTTKPFDALMPQVPSVAPTKPAEPVIPVEASSVASAGVDATALAAGAAEPVKPSLPALEPQVVAAVEAWRQAWSTRDMTAYLDSYSEAFAPQDGTSREDWVASRYRNVGGRKSIDVQIQRLQVLAVGEGRARATFLQDYTSGSFREQGQPKTLDLVKGADDRWRIVGEWQGNPPPVAEAGKS